MEAPPRPPARRTRPPAPSFRPEFTLLMLYFFALFAFFSMLLALPALLDALRELPPSQGPLTSEERAIAAEATREALRGRVPFAGLAALVVLAVGLYARVLPGLKRRPPGR